MAGPLAAKAGASRSGLTATLAREERPAGAGDLRAQPLKDPPAKDPEREPAPATRDAAAKRAKVRVDKPAAIRPKRRLSKLTARVLAVNLLGLAVMGAGVLFLSQYEDELLHSELANMQTEALIFAGALAESAVVFDADERQELDPEQARRMVRRLYETTDSRTRLFALDGSLLVDSRQLVGPGGIIEIEPLPEPVDPTWLRTVFDAGYQRLTALLPERLERPGYVEVSQQDAFDYAPVLSALAGSDAEQIWSAGKRRLVLGSAVPIQRLQAVLGAVFITRDNRGIERTVQSVREDILKVGALAMFVTVLMSLYLAGSITRPIRRLAAAAEIMRRGQGRNLVLPDFTGRRDEIGDLSGALRDMTTSIWQRMDAIEAFAADVAHEIKNPLTSLRSAVETLERVKTPEHRDKLLSVILQDVDRLDRLISDISDASRLDSELSRADAGKVDVREMMADLDGLYSAADGDGKPKIRFEAPGKQPLIVPGIEGRLVQVVRNLISNAVSFSPAGGLILVKARRSGQDIRITVTDEGPGIPPGAEVRIFERFYSERPSSEPFGRHSGLGLAISKQIVEAYGGTIEAANRRDRSGAVFTITVPANQPSAKSPD